jgi:hypothetical protein
MPLSRPLAWCSDVVGPDRHEGDCPAAGTRGRTADRVGGATRWACAACGSATVSGAVPSVDSRVIVIGIVIVIGLGDGDCLAAGAPISSSSVAAAIAVPQKCRERRQRTSRRCGGPGTEGRVVGCRDVQPLCRELSRAEAHHSLRGRRREDVSALLLLDGARPRKAPAPALARVPSHGLSACSSRLSSLFLSAFPVCAEFRGVASD